MIRYYHYHFTRMRDYQLKTRAAAAVTAAVTAATVAVALELKTRFLMWIKTRFLMWIKNEILNKNKSPSWPAQCRVRAVRARAALPLLPLERIAPRIQLVFYPVDPHRGVSYPWLRPTRRPSQPQLVRNHCRWWRNFRSQPNSSCPSTASSA